MSTTAGGREWDRFWQSGGGGRRGGCLPNAQGPIEPVLRATWAEFAGRLPRRARVLDLGTGDGAVLAMLRAKRPDLRLTGVDSAERLPRAPQGITLKAGVAMEASGFPDVCFEAVVSQFGLEYSNVAASARELARLLRTGGRCRFIVHHQGGQIVAHNLARREALAWAARDSGLIDKARNLTRARAVTPIPTSPAFAEAQAEARRRFGPNSAAEEFATAVRQTLDLGRRDVRGALEAIGELERRASDEMSRLEALAAAARDQDGIAQLGGALAAAGLVVEPATELHEQDGRTPFAWLVDGAKA